MSPRSQAAKIDRTRSRFAEDAGSIAATGYLGTMPEESATPDLVEIARRMIEATGRHDYQAVLADLDPELVIDDSDIPESTGADSFIEWLARWDEVWESWHHEGLEIRAAGGGRVIALFTVVAKGRGSGIELSRPDAVVVTFRGGKAVKLGYYSDRAEALKAVGMEA